MSTTPKKKNIEAIYPLSPLQQGMLFHYVYNPQSATYFEQFSVKLQGDLDVVRFKEAWQTVVQRHSALRTSFVWKKLDRMLQVVQRTVDIPFIEQDWRNLSESEQKMARSKMSTIYANDLTHAKSAVLRSKLLLKQERSALLGVRNRRCSLYWKKP